MVGVQKFVASFRIPYVSILDPLGKADPKLDPKLPAATLTKMYSLMVLSRVFDDKALALQRQGRLGTYAAVRGQEACQVGSAIQLDKKDWMFPAFREAAALITLGVPMQQIFQYWGGEERGDRCPEDRFIFPVSIPVGSHMVHAVGAGWAAKLRKEKTVAMTFFGDGATSEGDFHEALNFAGVFKTPTIFICQNNQWAISVPRERQSASETLAQKAVAYGFPGVQVDGNDLFAVYVATQEAIARARKGEGPTLIECVTYRIGDHTTSDDATRYRDAKEVQSWEKKDPITRLRKYLEAKRLWNETKQKQLELDCASAADRAVQAYETVPPEKPEAIFQTMYEKETPELAQQKQELLDYLSKAPPPEKKE